VRVGRGWGAGAARCPVTTPSTWTASGPGGSSAAPRGGHRHAHYAAKSNAESKTHTDKHIQGAGRRGGETGKAA
jgi:hypothetical protein